MSDLTRSASARSRLYTELAAWWPLFSPPSDYEEEAEYVLSLIHPAGAGGGRTLLELGSGGGSLAWHLKSQFRTTLSDLSAEMVEVSRAANPECEHFVGDMRTLRLGRRFDVVLIHDAIGYLTDGASVLAALETAAAHLNPGGTLLVTPDHLRETFAPAAEVGGEDGDDGRALRFMEWTYDPNPDDETFEFVFSIVFRHADGTVTSELDRHVGGLFPRASWLGWLQGAGFDAEVVTDPWDREIFLCVRK
jgi:SAM-dependent methyltransferase